MNYERAMRKGQDRVSGAQVISKPEQGSHRQYQV